MISISTVFWSLVIFFALLGATRGWARELISTIGLTVSLFAIQVTAQRVLGWLNLLDVPAGAGSPSLMEIRQRQFMVLSTFHLVMAFFSYQGPSLTPFSARLTARTRLQERLLGILIGTLNGYLIWGAIISFLEYPYTAQGWQRLAPGEGYPFALSVVVRPSDAVNMLLFTYLPLQVFGPYLVFVLVILLLFLFVVLI